MKPRAGVRVNKYHRIGVELRRNCFARVFSRGAGAAFVLFGLVSLASAQEPISPADVAAAEALFRDGRALLDAGKVAEACLKLAESHRLQPKPGTILNLAVCHEQQGKTATAWATYMEAAALAARLKQPERERAARDQAAVLEARLAKLILAVEEAPPGFSLMLDQQALSGAVAGTPIPVDPGDHEIVASAPGRQSFRAVVSIEPGPSSKTIAIPRLAEDRAAEPPPPVAPPPPAAEKKTDHSMKQKPAKPILESEASAGISGRKIAAYAVGGAGIAGVVVGSIFGALTFVQKGEGEDLCDGRYCSKEGIDAHAAAKTSSLVSTVGFGVGLAGLSAGLALFLTAEPRGPAAPRNSAFIAPALGPDHQGILLFAPW